MEQAEKRSRIEQREGRACGFRRRKTLSRRPGSPRKRHSVPASLTPPSKSELRGSLAARSGTLAKHLLGCAHQRIVGNGPQTARKKSVCKWRRSERRAVARSKPEASKKAPPVLSCPSWYSRALQISRQLCRTAVPLSFLILRVAPPSLFPTRSLSSRRLRAQKSTESHMQ